jgi:hypothetical protein
MFEVGIFGLSRRVLDMEVGEHERAIETGPE